MIKAKNSDTSRATSVDALEQIDFQNYYLIAKRRWRPTAAIFAATLCVSGLAASMQKPSYSAAGRLLLRPNKLPSLTGLGDGSTGQIPNLTVQSNPVRTAAESVLSRPVLQSTIDTLKLTDKKGNALDPETLASRIKVKDVAGADVIRVTYDDTDPVLAAKIVNQLMDEYLKSNVLDNRSEAASARRFISEQLPKTEATVRQADTELRRFKERNGVSDLKDEEQLLAGTIAEVEREIAATRTELAEVDNRFATLQNTLRMSSRQALNTSAVSQDPAVQQALSQLTEVQTQLQLERTRFQDKNPAIVQLTEREATLKSLIEKRVGTRVDPQTISQQDLSPGQLRQSLMADLVDSEIERLSVASRLASLMASRDSYRQQLARVPKLEQEQRQLQRRVEAAQSTYEALLKRLQEVELAEKQNVGTARIIEYAAVPDKATGSQAALKFMLGGLVGALLSLTTIAFLELRDKSVKTVKEVREIFGYTWLGTIPFFGKPVANAARRQEWLIPELPVRDAPRSTVSASYRMLQANLKFISLDEKLKSAVITSSVPKEGKSTIAANLAATMSALGRRTLLIDADLHHPSQHHIWNLTNEYGLSNVLVDQVDDQEAIVPVLENLDVLTCGVIPPNPLALLDSRRMASLIKSYEQQYDFVIIDAPPLVVEAEALTLGKISDGILLVARPGLVDVASATTAKELLEQSSQNVLGVVMNGALLESEMQRPYYEQEGYPRMPVAAM
jgi:capsular exopolysaccharide synthesis family protein